MKATGSIVMYSGRHDPSIELSPQIAKEICERLCNAHEVSDSKISPMLGPRGYRVIWSPEDGEMAPWVSMHVHNGIIALSCFATISHVKDTVGLESYLAEVLAPILKEHQEEAAKAFADYNEKVLGISEQKKI